MTDAWQPVLDGALADAARGAIVDIARELASGGVAPGDEADAVLFWAYAAGAVDDAWVGEAYDAAIDTLAAAVPMAGDLSLNTGAAGIGFAIAHVSEPGTVDDQLAPIDDAIARALAVEPWPDGFDLIGGLAGLAVYLLERGPGARPTLDRIVELLAATSERTPDGTTWCTPASLLPERHRAKCPDGKFDCGVAHGVPGAIAVLARIGTPAARELAADALRWLRARRLEHEDGRYPGWFARDRPPQLPARLAWCYGDIGVAITTLGAARRLGISTDDPLALARECTTRSFEHTGIRDAGLCHGAGGLAHMFLRIYRATGDTVFRDAARRWFECTLELRGPDGFLAWTSSRDEPPSWQPMTSLLEGTTGIGLALLAAVTPAEPSWDRLLLCDL